MKRRIVLLMLFITLSINAQWVESKGPYGGDLGDIKKDNKGNYYLITTIGLYKSIDNCESWQKIVIPKFENGEVYNELFIDPSGSLFLSTSNSYLLKNNETKTGWYASDHKGHLYLNSKGTLYGVDQRTIYKSTDTAKTWKAIKTLNQYIQSFCVVNDSNFVVACDSIFYSGNEGKTWKNLQISVYWGEAKFFIDGKNNIYFISKYELYRSNDFGNSWSIIKKYSDKIAFPSLYDFLWSVFVDKNDNIYCVTEAGYIVSTDAGTSWNILNKNLPLFFGFARDRDNNIYGMGYADGLYKWNEQTQDFQKKTQGINALPIRKLFKWKGKIVCNVGYDYYMSSDEGNTWERNQFPNYEDVMWISPTDRIFAIGSYQFYYSDDAINWTKIKFPDQNRLEDCIMTEIEGVILLCDQDNNLRRTADYGKNWETISLPVQNALNQQKCILGVTKTEIYFSQDNVLYKTTDYGTSWNKEFTADGTICSLSKSPWGNIFIGTKYSIYRNTLTGWNKIYIGLNSNIKKFSYSSNNQIIAFGNDIYCSDNFGKDFYSLTKGTNLHSIMKLSDLEAVGNTTIFLSQYYTSLLQRSISLNRTEIMERSFLYHNYPNPFNNQTTIEFFVKQPGNVTFVFSNILGQVMDSFTNFYQDAGFYKFDYKINNLASGVYFLTLRTLDGNQTKKMMLLK